MNIVVASDHRGFTAKDLVSAFLREKGHTVERYPDWWEGSSLYCAITRNPVTKVLQGGADPRCEAYAVGY